jgi:hypothetical protein
LLAGVNPHSPSAFAAVSLVLVVAVLAANLLPAHRAATVDPEGPRNSCGPLVVILEKTAEALAALD